MRVHPGFIFVAIVTASLHPPQAQAICQPTYAFVSDSGMVLAINLKTGALATVVKGLNDPRGIDLNPTETTLYIAETGGSRLLALDLSAGALTPIGSGWNGPTDVDVDSTGTTALVTQYGALVAV
ncbi:MAG TPA: hypothetical protein VGA64_00675, partial [Candidatus Polarisedimenticolia bacterium]